MQLMWRRQIFFLNSSLTLYTAKTTAEKSRADRGWQLCHRAAAGCVETSMNSTAAYIFREQLFIWMKMEAVIVEEQLCMEWWWQQCGRRTAVYLSEDDSCVVQRAAVYLSENDSCVAEEQLFTWVRMTVVYMYIVQKSSCLPEWGRQLCSRRAAVYLSEDDSCVVQKSSC